MLLLLDRPNSSSRPNTLGLRRLFPPINIWVCFRHPLREYQSALRRNFWSAHGGLKHWNGQSLLCCASATNGNLRAGGDEIQVYLFLYLGEINRHRSQEKANVGFQSRQLQRRHSFVLRPAKYTRHRVLCSPRLHCRRDRC